MGQLVELVFETVSKETAKALFQNLVAPSRGIESIHVDDRARALDMTGEQILSETKFCATVRLKGLDVPKAGVVPNASLRLLRTGENRFDVELNLDVSDVPSLNSLTLGLHILATDLAQQHGVLNFFAGLEPASDEDTRLFTRCSLGPFRFPGDS